MDIRYYVEILARRKRVVILTSLATLIVVMVGSLIMQPVFASTTVVRVAQAKTANVNYNDLNYTERLIQTYVEMVKSRPFMESTIQRLGLSLSVQDLSTLVGAEAIPNTELIRITAETVDPQLSAAIASTLGSLIIEQARSDGTLRVNNVTIVEPAVAANRPAKPNIKLNLILAIVLGLFAGFSLALLLENLDPTLHSATGLATITTVPLLGHVPAFTRSRHSPSQGTWLVDGVSSAFPAEAFRVLQTNLQALNHGVYPKTVLIASAEPRAGKSTIVANLATVIAQGGSRVVLVDGDLRAPCQHHTFSLPRSPGLADVIMGRAPLENTIRETRIPGLRVLTTGSLTPNPAKVWSAPCLTEILCSLANCSDVVLCDSAPILAAADTALLAPHVDKVLLVVTQNQSSLKHVELALTQLERVEAKVAGIIYNRADTGSLDYYGRYRRDGAELTEAQRDVGKWQVQAPDVELETPTI